MSAKYNCTSCGKPVSTTEALEAEKLMLEAKLVIPRFVNEILSTVLKAALFVLAITYLPEVIELAGKV